MPLGPGARLGPYEILSALGAGGMGEVYRARDTKLGRDVAIKVLPVSVALDTDRIARFEREAKLLASLNHPHIAAIYGVEESDGVRALVMELVDGDTLGDRIARGPLPVSEALRIAIQIAEALEAAHEKGVIHRDLKPANVKLTRDGSVKVLDFGLAKALEGEPAASANVSHSPTLSMMATQAGLILGTAAYMSPEQANGLPADQRSDVFAFGCVLFEMLTGRQLFQGETVPEILGSVLVTQPDLTPLPSNLNPSIVDVLRRCLEKNPKRRWQAIGDLHHQLETVAVQPHAITERQQAVAAPRPLWIRAIPIVITAIVVGIAARLIAVRNTQPGASVDITRFSVPVPDGKSLSGTGYPLLALSPDGKAFAFSANSELLVRSMSDAEPRIIFSPNANVYPRVESLVFSPDGLWIAFFTSTDGGTLKKVAVMGGAAVTLCKVQAPTAISWSDDQIVFSQPKGIMRVSSNGGEPQLLVPSTAPEVMSSPQLINDGSALLYVVTREAGPTRWEKADIMVQSLKSGEKKVLLRGGSALRYTPTGHIVYASGGTLFALRFDAKNLQVEGGPVPVLEGVARATNRGTASDAAQFSFSNNGSLVYLPGPSTGAAGTDAQQTLALADRNGVLQPLGLPAQSYYHPRFSPDGKQLVFGTDDGTEGIVWVYDLGGTGPPRRLTFGGSSYNPIWSRDGRYITFASDRQNDRGLFRQLADGTAPAERLTKAEIGPLQRPEQWSPDGKTLLFIANRSGDEGATGGSDLFTLSLEKGGNTQPLIRSSSNKRYAAFSPDGRWFAYASGEPVNFELFVEPFPPTGARYQISMSGGRDPVWSPDGKQLFYNGQTQSNVTEGRLVAVDVQTQSGFTFGKPAPIVLPGAILGGRGRNYDIAPDGKQFVVVLANKPGETQNRTQQINVVLNWFNELNTRVPIR